MKEFLSRAAVPALLLAVCSIAEGQQSAYQKRPPRLTTEEVLSQRVQQSAEVPAEEAAALGKQPTGSAGDREKVSPAEAAWRNRVKAAREKLKAAERAAEEAELTVTDLRNQLGSSGQTTRERNQTAADLDAAGARVTELRQQARVATDELNNLLAEGSQKRFSEAAPEAAPSPDDRKGNEDYYRKRYKELSEKLQTAERRSQLYENRLRDINQRIQNNTVSGDNFYVAKLQEEKNDAQEGLDDARKNQQDAQSEIDALKDQARRAGVAPGVFR